MSEEKVEIVRAAYDAFNRGDWDAVFRDMSPAVEFTINGAPDDSGPYRGRDQVEGRMKDVMAAWGTVHYEVDEFRESNENVVGLVRVIAQPEGSTASVESRVGHVWTIRDSQVVSLVSFPVREQALEAVGLTE